MSRARLSNPITQFPHTKERQLPIFTTYVAHALSPAAFFSCSRFCFFSLIACGLALRLIDAPPCR